MERFKPENGQWYYFVNSFGVPCSVSWNNDRVDNLRYDAGNCFRMEEEAQAKIDRDKAIASGRAVVVDVPEGWELNPDWGEDGIIGIWSGEKAYGMLHVCVKRTPPPPPKEITVKVYDVEVHGEPPDYGRPWALFEVGGKPKYFYTDELEGL